MSSDIVLTAALRNNLLSLQNTQSLIDRTQLRLATGRSVNSALDNAQSFFAAQSLNNRASDLSALLDGLGQSIQTIKAADGGITSLTSLVEQAQSIATTALEATSAAASSTSIQGNVDLSELVVASTFNGGTITFTATNSSDQEFALTNGTITLATNDTEQTIINAVNNITDADGDQVFKASLSSSGRLQIETLSNINFRIEIDGDGASTTSTSQALAAELGLGELVQIEDPTANTSNVVVTSKAASVVSSAVLYQSDGTTLAQRSTTLQSLLRDRESTAGAVNDDVFTVTEGVTGEGDAFAIEIGVNGIARRQISVSSTTTIQQLVDGINNDSVLKTRIQASFDESTGKIALTSLSADVDSIEIGAYVSDVDGNANTADQAGSSIAIDFGFGINAAAVTASANAANNSTTTDTSTIETIRISGGGGEISQLETDFNTVLQQIDGLVADAGYRGTNLLNGDDLLTVFNEDRSNTLTTKGKTFTVAGLGIDGAAFLSSSSVEAALTQTRTALNSVRDFGSSIANDLAIIQNREDFTKTLITTLQEGSDKLTVADQNEEGANLLALQTRQQLGVTSLSLASQSQQSVLRLF